MTNLICIAGGGAAGALLRYWTSGLVHAVLGRDEPQPTSASASDTTAATVRSFIGS